MRRISPVLLLGLSLGASIAARGQDPELAVLRKQVEEQAKAIVELRSALAELKASGATAPVPKGGAAPASNAGGATLPPLTPPAAVSRFPANESAEIGPTVRAVAPAPLNPWP